MKKTTWVFIFHNYSKYWSILLEHFIKRKPLVSKEWWISDGSGTRNLHGFGFWNCHGELGLKGKLSKAFHHFLAKFLAYLMILEFVQFDFYKLIFGRFQRYPKIRLKVPDPSLNCIFSKYNHIFFCFLFNYTIIYFFRHSPLIDKFLKTLSSQVSSTLSLNNK